MGLIHGNVLFACCAPQPGHIPSIQNKLPQCTPPSARAPIPTLLYVLFPSCLSVHVISVPCCFSPCIFLLFSRRSLSSPLSHYNSFSLTLNLPLSLSFTLGLFALRPLLISFISLSSLPSSSHSLPPYRLILLPPDLPPLPPINMDTHEVNDDIVVAFNEVLEVSHCERHRMLPVLVRQLRPTRCMQS